MNFYAARQPILNIDKSLFAYELLFRDGLNNAFPDIDDDQATSKMVAGLQFNIGFDALTQGKPAFINFTHNSLLNGFPLMLPHDQIVVEILETVKPGKKMLKACIELKEKGYILALDDYEHQPVWLNFFPYIDIIKIDYQLTPPEKIKEIAHLIKPFPNIRLLAEKIETHEEFQDALTLGCVYFQGYFFSRPEVIKSAAFSPSQFSLLNLMAEINMPEPDIGIITRAFETDVNLSYKLLSYAQSPIFKRSAAINSIRQALVILGQAEIERFLSLLFTAQFSDEKPEELINMSLVRARFCELIIKVHQPSMTNSSGFLVGLLSLLDALVDAQIDELMSKLPISQEIKDAIVLHEGDFACYLTLCEFFEKGQWEDAAQLGDSIGINNDKAAETFQEAILWATERTEMIG